MKRTRLKYPYNADGSTAFPARNVPGVYLIYKERKGLLGPEHELRYVGYGAKDVYKALYRHFQVWNDRQAELGQRGQRVSYRLKSSFKVRVIYCQTVGQARELEKALIIKHRPKDNPDKLELYELTDHGRELATVPDSAEWVTDDNAPF